jgi:hypothetical protein
MVMQNPYAPPETATSPSITKVDTSAPSKPIIPAVIGIFTYGSSSPYALVLCVEHYLNPNLRPTPWSTHIAAVLATIGSIAWFAMNIVYSWETIDLLVGRPTSMYAQIGLMMWLATFVFFGWSIWRFVRFV